MVFGTITTAIAGLFVAATTLAELQLAPTVGEHEGEAGIKSRYLIFSDGSGKEIRYTPPDGWEVSGSATKLSLRPRNKPQAEATITKVPLQEGGVLDDATMQKLADKALASIPKQSTDVAVISQEKNAVLINGKETFLITMQYTLFGQKYGRSLLFLNRTKEEVRFQLVSPLADFAALQRDFFGSQFTWEDL